MNRADEFAEDESLVDLRCSVLAVRNGEFLLIQRGDGADGDWVLPGGRPRPGEGMQSCARRETLEETGVRVNPIRCALVGEVIDPTDHVRIVELIFLATLERGDSQHPRGEPGTWPAFVPRDRLPSLHLRPPIAGYLPAFVHDARATAAYLGNLWRPQPTDRGEPWA
jgi:ADP-ribose pyrophosphatase YjhB (NUDIX family)